MASTPSGRGRQLLIGIAALAVAGSGLGLALAAGGASTVTLHGAMMITPAADTEFGDNFTVAGTRCEGSGGYDDLTEGASVTIQDAAGKVIGTGSLGAGRGASGLGCIFNWRVPNVPKSKFYGVEISHRGTVDFKSDEIKSGFDTSIGN